MTTKGGVRSMRKEVTVGDFNTSYFKVVGTEADIKQEVYANKEEAVSVAEKHSAKVMRISKRVLHTMQFERVY